MQWLRDSGPFAVIGFDTLLESAHHGTLCTGGMDYLNATLSAFVEQPVIVATHHPFMRSAFPRWMRTTCATVRR